MIAIWFICLVLVTRFIEFKIFMNKVSKACNDYDWKFINENPECLVDKMKNENDYFLTSEWSAYNFLFLKGPSPKKMFLSFKPLTIEKQYNKEVVDKLKKYEIK